MQDNIVYELKNPVEKVHVKIDGKNEFMDLTEIYLQAPSFRQKNSCIVLKKKYMEAVFAMTKHVDQNKAQKEIDQSSDDDKVTAQAVKFLLNAAQGFDIIDFYNEFNKFLASGIAFKDESFEQKLLVSDLDKLSEGDQENIVAKYIEVFFVSSWMDSLK